jgi:hypothetical protein
MVMNDTCIHMSTKDINIYKYKRWRIYKELTEKNIIIEKHITYLIPYQTYGGSTTLSLKR